MTVTDSPWIDECFRPEGNPSHEPMLNTTSIN